MTSALRCELHRDTNAAINILNLAKALELGEVEAIAFL
jgi:transposase